MSAAHGPATSSLSTTLRSLLQEKGRSLYMPYFTLGDPDFETSVLIADAMIRGGADILELGIPFSDPTADGPVIQKAMVRSMAGPEFSLDRIFEVTAQIHALDPAVPLVFLTYINPVLSSLSSTSAVDVESEEASASRFFDRAGAAGIRGLVIPDLPFDSREARLLRKLGERTGIEIAGMIAPNTSEKRLREIAGSARGFIYYVTSHGVTGERSSLPADITARLEKVRSLASVPVFAGFGISRPEQAAMLAGHVDGVIVGTAHHRLIEEDVKTAPAKIEEMTRKFTEALRVN